MRAAREPAWGHLGPATSGPLWWPEAGTAWAAREDGSRSVQRAAARGAPRQPPARQQARPGPCGHASPACPGLIPALVPLLAARHGGGRRPGPSPRRPQPHPGPPAAVVRPLRDPHPAELPLGHPAAWGDPLAAAAGPGSRHPCPPAPPARSGVWQGRGRLSGEDAGHRGPTHRWVCAAGRDGGTRGLGVGQDGGTGVSPLPRWC